MAPAGNAGGKAIPEPRAGSRRRSAGWMNAEGVIHGRSG